MISLADGIARIGIVIGAPEQPRPRSRLLSLEISRVYFEPRIRCFVDHAKDSFAFHGSEIRMKERLQCALRFCSDILRQTRPFGNDSGKEMMLVGEPGEA